VVRLGLTRHRTADDEVTETIDRPETVERIETRRPGVDDGPRDTEVRDTRVVERPVEERPVEERPAEEAPPRWVRVSALATLGLIVGLAALFATLTGLLAPVGVAAGVVGGAISAGGLVGASRRGVTGHSVALLGLLLSIAAIVLGVMAMGGYLPWLDSRTDEVLKARDWLNAHLSFLRSW
jgi:hypothetical protein